MDSQLAEVVTLADSATLHHVSPDVMQRFVMDGDLSEIAPAHRPALIMALCRHIGVDPIERPFMVFKDGKKVVLYAARACTSALCRERKISRELLSIEEKTIAGQPVIIARARATATSGRYDESTGVVPVMQADTEWQERGGRQVKVTLGWRMPDPTEAANLPMKAETKAKRRAVLDLVGLGMPDESEIEGIRGARIGRVDMASGEIAFVDATALAPAPAPKVIREKTPADVIADLHVDIAGRVNEIAAIMKVDKAHVYCGAVKAAGLPRDTPIEALDHMASVAVLDRLYVKLASLRGEPPPDPAAGVSEAIVCAELYDKLCAAAPADYEPGNWRREWAAMLALDEWPENPTAAQYGEVAEHIARILGRVEA